MSQIEQILLENLDALDRHWKHLERELKQRLDESESRLKGYEIGWQKVLDDSATFYTEKLRSFQEDFEKSLHEKLTAFREEYESMLEARTQEHEERMNGLKEQLTTLNDRLDKLFEQIRRLE